MSEQIVPKVRVRKRPPSTPIPAPAGTTQSANEAVLEQQAEGGAVTSAPAPIQSTEIAESPECNASRNDGLKHQIVYRPPAGLRPYEKNPRRHHAKQIAKIAAGIQSFGFIKPIIIDASGKIIAGEACHAVAMKLSLKLVPTIAVTHLTPEEVRAYRIADNRLAEDATWDDDLLRIELTEIEGSVELTSTGFEIAEIDLLLTGTVDLTDGDPADDVETPQGPAITQLGDLWCLGTHRLLCADAQEPSSYEQLLGGASAQAIITDPPYNVRIEGHVSGLGKTRHREFVMASGEMSRDQFTAFLRTVLQNLAAASIDGALIYLFIDWRHLREMMDAAEGVFAEFKNLIVWAKDNAGMGSFYRSQHELVLVYKHGTAPHINNFGLGSVRYRTNVWSYPGANSMKAGRLDELAMHPTMKPVAMIADAVLDSTQRGGIVLDPFGGSGTTVIAAQRTGRRAYVLELDPLYVDVTIRRWEKLFREPARHVVTGLTFAEMTARRSAAAEVRHG
jgi:DNA modification methylase